MKLTIAFGILSQTLPVISDQSVGSFQLPVGRRHDFPRIPTSWRSKNATGRTFPHAGLKRNRLSSILKQKKDENLELRNSIDVSGRRECDPSSADPDIGVLSCGESSYCMHNQDSATGGVCAPMRKSGNRKFGSGNFHVGAIHNEFSGLECNPSSSSADIGILSCKDGQQCVESAHSSLGGFCSSMANFRKLSPLMDGAAICDPLSELYMYYDCDCTGFDATAGTGVVPCTAVENYCLGLVYNGCRGTCITRTMNYTFQNFETLSYSLCYASTTPYSQKICFTQNLETPSCQVEFDGAMCSSCTFSGPYSEISFDCTNVGGGVGTKISEGLPVVAGCYQPIENPTQCRLCPVTGTAFNPSFYQVQVNITGYGTYGCYALADRAYYFQSISESICPTISAATTSRCCSEVCFVCGAYSYIPVENSGINLSTAIEGFEGTTCGDLASSAYQTMNISESVCTAASGLVQACCKELPGIPETTNPTAALTNAPMPTSSGLVPTSTPGVNKTAIPTLRPSPITQTPSPTVAPVFTSNLSATEPPSISITSTLPPFLSNSTPVSPSNTTTDVPLPPTADTDIEPDTTSGADARAFFNGIRLLSLVGVATIASSLLVM